MIPHGKQKKRLMDKINDKGGNRERKEEYVQFPPSQSCLKVRYRHHWHGLILMLSLLAKAKDFGSGTGNLSQHNGKSDIRVYIDEHIGVHRESFVSLPK